MWRQGMFVLLFMTCLGITIMGGWTIMVKQHQTQVSEL
jgi:hypothetical protein